MQNIKLSEIEFMKLVAISSLDKRLFTKERKKELSIGLTDIAKKLLDGIFVVILEEKSNIEYREQVETILRTSGKLK